MFFTSPFPFYCLFFSLFWHSCPSVDTCYIVFMEGKCRSWESTSMFQSTILQHSTLHYRESWEIPRSGLDEFLTHVLLTNSLDSNCVSVYWYNQQKYFLPLRCSAKKKKSGRFKIFQNLSGISRQVCIYWFTLIDTILFLYAYLAFSKVSNTFLYTVQEGTRCNCKRIIQCTLLMDSGCECSCHCETNMSKC